MWADGVVVAPPGFDDNLRLLPGVEILSVQELVGQARVEALDVSTLPGRNRLDERRSGRRPPRSSAGDEHRAVVGADIGRDAA